MEELSEKSKLKTKVLKLLENFNFKGRIKRSMSLGAQKINNNRENTKDPIKTFFNELSRIKGLERKEFFVKRVYQYFIKQEYYLSDKDKNDIKITYKDIDLALSDDWNQLNDSINNNDYEGFLSYISKIKENLHYKLLPYLTLETVISTFPVEKAHNLGKMILEELYPEKNFIKIGTSGYTAVFEEKGGDIVYKLNTRLIIKSMANNFGNVNINKGRYEIDRTYEQEMLKMLRKDDYFGEEGKILTPKEIVVDGVKIPSGFIEGISRVKKGFKNNKKDNFTLKYTTAPLAKEIRKKDFTSFNFNRNLHILKNLLGEKKGQEFYNKIEYGNGVTKEELKDFLNKRFQDIASEINNSELLKDFLQRLIKFSKENNSMVDIFGADNVTFFKNEKGEIDYHLIDPAFVYPQPLLTEDEAKKGEMINKNNFSKYTFYYLLPIFEDYCKNN